MDGEACSLAVRTGGAGNPPLVLLHGFPLTSASYDPVREAVEAVRRVITVDLRGFGRSDAPAGPYDMEVLAEDVVRAADLLGVDRFILGGHSMGGYVSFRLAARHPERLAGLVLIDTRAAPDSPEGVERRRAGMAEVRDGRRGAFLERMLPSLVAGDRPEVLEMLRAMAATVPDHVLVGCLDAMARRPDSRRLLRELDVPALVITSTEDQLLLPGEPEEMAAELPRGRLEVIPGAGHCPMLDHPEAFADALIRFLADVEPGQRS